MITDRGPQFQTEYRAWCRANSVRPRFGAIGKKGSIAIVERFIMSLKQEFLWKIFVPFSLVKMEQALASYQRWYNEHRPHASLAGCTPAEVLAGVMPAKEQAHWEPRARLPLARGDPNVNRCAKLDLVVSYVDGHKELPIVELRKAA